MDVQIAKDTLAKAYEVIDSVSRKDLKPIYRCICGVQVEENGQMHDKCRQEFFGAPKKPNFAQSQPPVKHLDPSLRPRIPAAPKSDSCPGCNGSRGAHSKFCEEYL